MSEAKVAKIVLGIDGQKIELSPEQAKELRSSCIRGGVGEPAPLRGTTADAVVYDEMDLMGE